MSDKKVVIAGYARSPFTPAGKGDLKDIRADDLAAQVINGLVEKTGVDPAKIEDVKVGCAMPEGEQGLNIGRLAGLISGLPQSVPASTTNRFCGSSMDAIHQAAGMISMGMADAVIAVGIESMSHVPMGGFNPSPNPKLYASLPGAYMGMGETAENVANKFDVSREEQDKFALRSQFKAVAAKKDGKLAAEIVPIVTGKGKTVAEDGCPRDTTFDGLSKLKPAFKKDGSVTAGTSSPITDGAAAVLICSEEFARANGLEILAEIKSFAVTGCAPEIMGMGPVGASKKALDKAGISIKDVDIVEINEAFAAQSIACLRALEIDEAKVNLHGGAIALGHPLGATGARITGKAAQLLHDEGKEYALVTQCIGGGQGIATVLKRVAPQPKQ